MTRSPRTRPASGCGACRSPIRRSGRSTAPTRRSSSPNGPSSMSSTGPRSSSTWPATCSSTGATSPTATRSRGRGSPTRESDDDQRPPLGVQALILAGGEGTRLRPLTSTVPKPVVPLVDRPFIVYMIEWLRGHGVDYIILACGFMADGVRSVLGDGSALGVRLRYVEEPTPLGTGGALKHAEELLDERFFMLNGDVLTDMDLTAELAQHEQTGALATLALIPVEDPSAYGLVPLHSDNSVREFIEKPGAEQTETDLINAGAYIIERSVLNDM